MHLQRVGGRRERKRGEIHLHLVYKKKTTLARNIKALSYITTSNVD